MGADTLPILTADQEAIVAVRALHRPFPLYDACGHDHAYGDPGVVEVEDIGLTCEDGRFTSVCGECCTDGQDQTLQCADYHVDCWPCATVKAITAALGGAR
jgi:hypothetical protein